MKIRTINYLIKDAFKSFKRNKTISIASIITVLITFFVLGLFLIIVKNANIAINGVEDKIEIQVFLKEDIKLIEEREIQIKIKEQPGIEEVVYESKEDAYNKVLEKNPNFLKGYKLETNPFPSSYVVKIKDVSQIDNIVTQVENLPGVESIKSQQEMIEKMQGVIDTLRLIGIILFIVLIFVSVFLIMNTTKLTVYSRRREVGIMKFVGATDWFIRLPFIIEGMLIGVSGAILSTILLYFSCNLFNQYVLSSMTMVLTSVLSSSYILTTLIWQFAIGGIVVGAIASILALRKFLKV